MHYDNKNELGFIGKSKWKSDIENEELNMASQFLVLCVLLGAIIIMFY